ncbi:hypothetical protein AN958_07434 [Leucoagaricus sp. SymC.cos]|nr:hypothetical protein AN958_07434 [Leucoagaricus sp. SymC.cos]
MEDRTIIPMCSHEFCFDCLIIWTAQSRRCPLCTQTIGGYLIHDIRSRFDYRKHHLPPLISSPPQPLLPRQTTTVIEARNAVRRRRRDRQRESQRREDLDERDKLELSVATRRWVYKHDLYAKVCIIQNPALVTLILEILRSNSSHASMSHLIHLRSTVHTPRLSNLRRLLI